jgi:hypothetical protein
MEYTQIGGERYFKLPDSAALRPFFMSIVSDSDHWMFISSNGGLSAGRKNADYALFPYYTDDKITESVEMTGSKSVFWVKRGEKSQRWEPFSDRDEGVYRITRNLYKHVYGNKIIFEELNHDLQLSFQVAWNTSDQFGFVRKSSLHNHADHVAEISLLDGIQNIMPSGVPSSLQNTASNLVDAYKRSELDSATGLGIFALSAIIVDKAEPSEALKANVAWSNGLENPTRLLSSLQVSAFRKGQPLHQETDVKAEKGAYFLHQAIHLPAQTAKSWQIVANVNQSHSAVARLRALLRGKQDLQPMLEADIAAGTKRLLALNAAADGLQRSSDHRRDTRHFSNALFNIMRGGIFDDNYQIEKWDFSNYLSKANKDVFEQARARVDALPETFSLFTLKTLAEQSGDPHFTRLSLEYLPLKFSRRHGDPSRPWNWFSINTRSEKDGSKILDYQGNWRDIFQNWEALAHAYPAFIENMVYKFLNASTFDGYNPYRVTKDGFDWETIEPDNPWSYIGYWGDHQIIYLLKFLEFMQSHTPGRLEHLFNRERFVYANVPYRIKTYAETLQNPKDTIAFDHDSDKVIHARKALLGADGALLQDQSGRIHTVSFIEKILATVLAKLSNFIPEAGIWMNTQRPEWNDANNALVGNGVSVVTLCYLRRFLAFFKNVLTASAQQEVAVSEELLQFLNGVAQTLQANAHLLDGKISDTERKRVLDGLGQAGSDYRTALYERSFSGGKQSVSLQAVRDFFELALKFLEHTIEANKRSDNMYHAYNLMSVEGEDRVSIAWLSEMLEGQVAVLSAGYLSAPEVVGVLDSLKASRLYRPDQNSYLLYPNKALPGFLEKNIVPAEAVGQSRLLGQLLAEGNTDIVERDVDGVLHFNSNFKNAADLHAALEALSDSKHAELAVAERGLVLQIFEDLFNHKAFTGRSGTFYGYEGLGSIYWHMVSKLQLAVLECCRSAVESGEAPGTIQRMLAHYYDISEGIGVHKSPAVYGAFPTDPYSHTPAGKGAQQPGMTGQVKEDLLSRFGELGVWVQDGCLQFNPSLLRKDEFLQSAEVFEYVDVHQETRPLSLAAGTLAFTYCQTPIVYALADANRVHMTDQNGATTSVDGLRLDADNSRSIFERRGDIVQIRVEIRAGMLHGV